MTVQQILGHRSQQLEERGECLTLAFSPLNGLLRTRWRNNGLSADFLGDYVTTFLPADDSVASAWNHQAEIRHAVTYIANELLENAMKYHEHDVNIPIGIRLELTSECITVSASNGIGAAQAKHYQAFVQKILNEDAGDLLVRQLEGNGDTDQSCLGLLTMITDYGAQLGWRFEGNSAHSEVLTVITSAILPLSNFSGVSA